MPYSMWLLASRQQIVRFALVSVTACCLILVSPLTGAQPDPLSQKAPEAQLLIDRATADGHVRVLVEFAAPYEEASLAASAASLDAARDQVRAAQDAILEDHFGSATAPLEGAGFSREVLRLPVSPLLAVTVTLAEAQALAADPGVVRIHLSHEYKPNLNETLPIIGMPAAYAKGGNGVGHLVAVLDTGIQANHEFLTGKVATEACVSTTHSVDTLSLCPGGISPSFAPGAANAMVPQCDNLGVNLCFHGSHVAGIAAGFNTSLTAGEPVSGVARNSRIIPVQVYHRHNDAAGCAPDPAPCLIADLGDVSFALDRVYLAAVAPSGERLAAVNLSLGGTTFPGNCDFSPLKILIDKLRTIGVATVVATGDGSQSFASEDPACISTAIAVGSTTEAGGLSPTTNVSSATDVLAPGSGPATDILSSVPNNTYAALAGTSFAAPHVAGAFAAIRSACPTIGYNSAGVTLITNALTATGVPVTDTRFPGGLTKPLIRVDLAIDHACAAAAIPPPPPPPHVACNLVATPDWITRGEVLELSWTSSNAVSGVIDNGVGFVGPTGSVFLAPQTPTTYYGVFTGPLGTGDCHVTVLVFEPQHGAFEPLTLLGLSGLAAIGLLRRRRS